MLYGYTRVSTLDQTNGASLEDQERIVGAVATLRGMPVTRLFTDPGVSGSVPLEQRPQGSALVALLQPGDVVVTAKLDRMFRSAGDALNTADGWKRGGIDLIVADIGSEPVTQHGVAKMFFGMLALVAEFERTRILERIEQGRVAKLARGGHCGGRKPFGSRVIGEGREARLEPHPQEQKAMVRMQRLRAKGRSLREIAAAITKSGYAVSHVTVGKILSGKTGNKHH